MDDRETGVPEGAPPGEAQGESRPGAGDPGDGPTGAGKRARTRHGTRGGQRRRASRGAQPAKGASPSAEGAVSPPATEHAASQPAEGVVSPGGPTPAPARTRSPRRKKGEAAGAPVPSSAPEPRDETPGKADAASQEPGRSSRRGGRRRKARGVTSEGAPAAPDAMTAQAASAAAPDASLDAAAATADGDDAESGGAPKRRRRGTRGGRRVRAREARKAALAAADDGASPIAPAEAVPVEAAAETSGPAGGEEPKPAEKRRARRGGRRRQGQTETAADQQPVTGASDTAEAAKAEAAVPETAAAGTAAFEMAEATATGPAEPAAAGERKRSRRGGRRAKRATETAATEPAAVDEPVTAAAPAADDTETKKGRRRDRRRPKAIVRPEALTGADADAVAGPALTTGRRPEVSVELARRKLILVTEDPSELRVALVEDGRLAEIYFERPEKRSYLGDIYRGKVENVLAGIDAAFVDFGLDKNGFLYVDEVRTGEGDRRGRRIGDVLKPGQDVLVQVMKDPMGSKGARLTMHISLAGRYVVYVPGGSGVGVSRRLGQAERERLRELCKELRVKSAGLIVRTAAEGEGLEEIRRDVRVLSRLWSRLKKKAETAPIPGLIHKEVDISLEVTRDLFNESVESLIVDDEKRHKAIVSFLDKVAPELVPRVRLHRGAEPLFEAYGIEQQISRALERRVPLPSGGNIVIDHAEALTVIDVNSGRYTSGKGLEDTILRTNLEAAREVVRQLRLRDIGGIIIIDFIDMARVKNRETVLATLEAELDTDRTKTYVVELSPLGLVEMTRQNTTDGARGILTRTCATCQGKARTLSEETVALTVERRLRVQSRRSGAKACLVEVNTGVAERLVAGGRLKKLEKETGRRIFLEGSSSVAVDAFRFLAEGSVDQVQSQRIPVREGQEVEVELEYALTYSARDAVGYVDGYMVIVEGGRPFLGQRRKVRVTGTSRTGASATLTGGRGGGG
jgi:ribonuclease G